MSSIRYYLYHNGETTGPHEAVETYLAWQEGRVSSQAGARRESDPEEWLPLSAALERDGFDVAGTKRTKKDAKIVTLADLEKAAQAKADAKAAYDATPACPLCQKKQWANTRESNGGAQLAGCLVFILLAAPAGCSILVAGASGHGGPLAFAAVLIGIPLVIFGSMKRHFRQCQNCRYRYQIK